jgi:hypothetical protein
MLCKPLSGVVAEPQPADISGSPPPPPLVVPSSPLLVPSSPPVVCDASDSVTDEVVSSDESLLGDVLDDVSREVRSEVGFGAVELEGDEVAALDVSVLPEEVAAPVDVDWGTLVLAGAEVPVPDEDMSMDEAVEGCSPLSCPQLVASKERPRSAEARAMRAVGE